MRRPRLLLSAACAAACALAGGGDAAALELPATAISYRIEAEVDPATRALKGSEEIRWRNETGEPVTALPLHLYLNAFANRDTTWMREIAPGRLQFGDLSKREPDPWGYIEPTSIRQRVAGDGGGERDAAWRPIQPDDGNPNDRSLAEVTLPAPVGPGEEVVLTIAFEGRLPVPIARTGGRRDFFLVGQWFPKIGVIEAAGVRHAPAARRAARQFHGPTEFYADFADYDVTLVAPAGWMVGATGRAQGDPAPRPDGRVAVRHAQRAVHDFAWVMGQNLVDRWARHQPRGGGPAVDVRYITPAGTEHQIPRWQRGIEGALDVLGSRVGPYPYDVLTVVLPPFWADRTSGMEYPTFITGAPGDPLLDNPLIGGMLFGESTAIHEFGHQYFYGLLASNEQEEAFLDEGFNTYWEGEIMGSLYGEAASSGHLLGRPIDGRDTRALALGSLADRIQEPMRKRPTWLFGHGTWGAQAYPRSAVTFATAAGLFGQDQVDRVFAEYFRRFAFKHPDADDFLGVAAEVGGADFGAFCREAFERERIPDYVVTAVEVEPWEAPLGRVTTAEGPVLVTRENRAQHAEVGLPPEAREADGRVVLEVTDPGWVRGGESRTGTIERTPFQPERGAPAPGYEAGKRYYQSAVTITGPGWDTLPVEVELRFADGAVVRDRWDGKAAWRSYRAVRPAPLVDARLDPGRKIVLDPTPQNNALAAEPDGGFTADWGLWLGALTEWLAGGLSLWL